MAEGSKPISMLVLVASALLMLAFFLPAYGDQSYLDRTYIGLKNIDKLGAGYLDHVLHLLFALIPIIACVMELTRNGRSGWKFLFGATAMFLWALGATAGFKDLNLLTRFDTFSAGYYITVFAAILYLVAAFTPKTESQ